MQKNIIKLEQPELSYKIIGTAFDVYNSLGAGHKEKYYQNALALAFKKGGLNFREQVLTPLSYENQSIGRYYLDFLVENKIVVELKSGEKFLKQNIQQIFNYLRANKLPLGLLINFTKEGVKSRRILNII